MATNKFDDRQASRTRVRLVREGAELFCPHCAEWWPITEEFWTPGRMWTCRAYATERSRLYQVMRRRRDPAWAAREVARAVKYRAWLRRVAPDYVKAYDRERKAVKRAAQRARRAAIAAGTKPISPTCSCGHVLASHRQDAADPYASERCKTCGCAAFLDCQERGNDEYDYFAADLAFDAAREDRLR